MKEAWDGTTREVNTGVDVGKLGRSNWRSVGKKAYPVMAAAQAHGHTLELLMADAPVAQAK